jgi:choline/glycine/proline betaine transport protein|tara:strand:- start:374 stop:640 length:267 start_codon:yes stop_codon:yes gene_type:complete
MQSTDKQSCKLGFWGDIRSVMVTGSALLVVTFVLFTVINPDYAGTVFNSARDFIASNLSWYYITLMNFYLIFALLLPQYCSIAEVCKP